MGSFSVFRDTLPCCHQSGMSWAEDCHSRKPGQTSKSIDWEASLHSMLGWIITHVFTALSSHHMVGCAWSLLVSMHDSVWSKGLPVNNNDNVITGEILRVQRLLPRSWNEVQTSDLIKAILHCVHLCGRRQSSGTPCPDNPRCLTCRRPDTVSSSEEVAILSVLRHNVAEAWGASFQGHAQSVYWAVSNEHCKMKLRLTIVSIFLS